MVANGGALKVISINKIIRLSIAVLLFVAINVDTFSYALDYEYGMKNQETILKNIKDPEKETYIRSIMGSLDEYLNEIRISEGKQLDAIDNRFYHSDLNKVTGGYGLGQRKSTIERIRKNNIISANESIFKIYVSKGKFGKYNKNRPVVVPDNTKFYANDSKGRKWMFSTGRDRYLLPADKSELFVDVALIQGSIEETVPAKIDWIVDGIYYADGHKKAIRVTNLKPIKFAERVFESDNDYKKRMIVSIDYLRDYVLQKETEINH